MRCPVEYIKVIVIPGLFGMDIADFVWNFESDEVSFGVKPVFCKLLPMGVGKFEVK